MSINRVLLLGFCIRLMLIPWTYHGDVSATYWWGRYADEFGWRGFYDWLDFFPHSRPDQPMLNIYYDWIVRQIYHLIYYPIWFLNTHISLFPSKIVTWYVENGNQVLLKVPMIFADTLLIYLVYNFIKPHLNKTKATFAAIILAFYPPMIINSAVWGSGDSIVNLCALLSMFFLYQKKYLRSFFFIIVSILYKPSLLIWLPIYPTVIYCQKPKITSLIVPIIAFATFIYTISVPFAPYEINPLIWFFRTMTSKILPGYMPYLTAYATNIWSILFGMKLTPDNIFIVPGITARITSLLVCSFLYAIVLIRLVRHYNLNNLVLSLIQFAMITFTFMTRMHERYSFPALIPLLIYSFYHSRYLKSFIILTIVHTINISLTWWVPTLLELPEIYIPLSITVLIISLGLLRIPYKETFHTVTNRSNEYT